MSGCFYVLYGTVYFSGIPERQDCKTLKSCYQAHCEITQYYVYFVQRLCFDCYCGLMFTEQQSVVFGKISMT